MFDKMIIFEPFEDNVYCNQVEKQLIARIHRIGRSKPVDVYRFITEGTIEETIYKLTPN
jgi:SNF2 family DNA or RNA helicase